MSESKSCRVLSGHKKDINCLDTKYNDSNLLVSGSDDETIRLWDLRTNKTQKCFLRCFNAPIESTRFGFKNDYSLYAASHQQIYTFDIRMGEVLITTPIGKLDLAVDDLNDEINAMELHPKQDFLAVSDDSGAVTVFPLDFTNTPILVNEAGVRFKKLTRKHTSVVGALSFRPKSQREIISGGFDCQSCLWDFSRGRPLNSVLFTTGASSTSPETQQPTSISPMNIINPPFVHAIGFTGSGREIVCALGDGSLRLLQSPDCTPLHAVQAHTAMATALHIAGNTVISGGGDKILKFWNVISADIDDIDEKSGAGNSRDELLFANMAISSGAASAESSKERKTSKKSKAKAEEMSSSMSKLKLSEVTGSAIEHGHKVNAISASRSELELMSGSAGGTIAVADTTKNISIYTL